MIKTEQGIREMILFRDDVMALYDLLRYHYINYENHRAISLVREMEKFLDDRIFINELVAKRTNELDS